MRRGILLAGGRGTRLSPMTRGVSKQLLPLFDKPMVYYPLTTLMRAGLRDVLVISTPADVPRFAALLGPGDRFGMRLSYAAQNEPRGIAEALIIAEPFLRDGPAALALGDNLFDGPGLDASLGRASRQAHGATVFVHRVADPRPYGVLRLGADGRPMAIEEKPRQPTSDLAVTGLYFYDARAVEIAKALAPSRRGELEITDVNRAYLRDGRLSVEVLGEGAAWFDSGTPEALLAASSFVAAAERRAGRRIGCPEEIAWRNGWIGVSALERAAEAHAGSAYGEHLLDLVSLDRPAPLTAIG